MEPMGHRIDGFAVDEDHIFEGASISPEIEHPIIPGRIPLAIKADAGRSHILHDNLAGADRHGPLSADGETPEGDPRVSDTDREVGVELVEHLDHRPLLSTPQQLRSCGWMDHIRTVKGALCQLNRPDLRGQGIEGSIDLHLIIIPVTDKICRRLRCCTAVTGGHGQCLCRHRTDQQKNQRDTSKNNEKPSSRPTTNFSFIYHPDPPPLVCFSYHPDFTVPSTDDPDQQL